jgi:hypothetical protein
MIQRAGDPIDFERDHYIDFGAPHLIHQLIERIAISLGTGTHIRKPAKECPPPTLAVLLKLQPLAVVILLIGADAKINGDSWFHRELESLKIIPSMPPSKNVRFSSR